MMSMIVEQYLETAGVALVAAIGVLVGMGISRLRGKFWLVGYLMPLAIVVHLAAYGNRSEEHPFAGIHEWNEIYWGHDQNHVPK